MKGCEFTSVHHFTHCNDNIHKIVWKVWTGIKYHALLLMDISKLKEFGGL